MEECRRIHPKMQFCGDPPNAILDLPEDLLNYVLSILRENPVPPPELSIRKWSESLPVLAPHGIIPLLYWLLKELPEPLRPPAEIMEKMDYAFLMQTVRAVREERQVRDIVAAFEEEGVRILALKGFALARMVYPDPATRPGADLDLLALPEQMPLARTILENIGYDCAVKMFDTQEKLYKDEYFVHKKHLRYFRKIELHWQLHSFLGIRQEARTEELFDRAIKVETESLIFEALDPVDSFIHKAINNAYGHDEEMRLGWIYDITLLARKLKAPDDWELLQKRCVEWRARFAVELSIEMARAWLGLKLPQGFDDFSTWPQPTDSEANGWSKLITRHHRFLTLLSLRMPPCTGVMERVRLLARLVFPLRDKVCRDFPPPHDLLFPLSYVYRWWHWVEKLTRTNPNQRSLAQRRKGAKS